MNEETVEDIFPKESKLRIFFGQLKRSFAIMKKDIRIYYNKAPVIIQGILFPVMLFLAFTLGREIMPIYLTSGLLTMVLFLTATSIGPVVFPWETRQRTIERLIACPISVKTILLGNVWSSFAFGSMISAIPLILGLSVYGMWSTTNFVIIIFGIIIAALAFSCFSLLLSVPPTDMPANTMILTIVIKFPLIFISPLFLPIAKKPLELISPLTYFIDLMNVGLGENSAFGSYGILIDFSVLVSIGVVSLLLSFFLHEKTLQKRL